MKRKSPGYIKLMGHSRNSTDIPRVRDIRTASSLFMTREERESLGSAMDFRALGIDTRREIDKFARQDAAVEKFKKNYFIAREKLTGKINKNRALMELRHELQQRRRMGKEPASQSSNDGEGKRPTSENTFNHVEVRY